MTVMSFIAHTEAVRLKRLLPGGVSLSGEPRVRITVSSLKDVGWLAGRGYNVLSVQIPARVDRTRTIDGEFVAVLWENLADPIITGREELGMPKMFADIPDLARDGDSVGCLAAWGGYTFFEGWIENLSEQQEGLGKQAAPVTINHKYQPRTGQWGTADADYLTCSAPEWTLVTSLERGDGHASFRSASWQQLPTLAHVVNVLAGLPLEVTDATLATIKGTSDYIGQQIVD
jgi:hypothetical protein